jgi:hypothetical protein
MSVSTKLLCKVAMPYDGGSVTGLIILLHEVAMPHANDAAYGLFCSSFPLKLNTNVMFW